LVDGASPVANECQKIAWRIQDVSIAIGIFVFIGDPMFRIRTGGHLGTPQEQQACSRDASRFCQNN
jgi:hypothetical protein